MKYQNDRLELAVIVSILLHLILIGLLFLGSLFTKTLLPSAGGSGGDSDSFEAVMVDTGQVAAEYGRLKADKQGSRDKKPEPVKEEPKEEVQDEVQVEPVEEQIEIVDNSAEIAKQKEQERALQIAQQKAAEEKRLQEEKRKQEQAKREQQRQEQLKQEQAKREQEEATRKKEAEAARLKADAEAKRLEAAAKQAEEERKAKVAAEKAAKEKAAAEAKAKAAAEAKAKAEQAKKNKALDDFLSGGDIGGGSSKGGNRNSAGSAGSGGTSGAGKGANVDGSRYIDQISRLLKSKFRNAHGQPCYVKIHLERNGVISNYQVVRGPADVCDAAVKAIVATKKVPAAPSDAVYQQVRSSEIIFKP